MVEDEMDAKKKARVARGREGAVRIRDMGTGIEYALPRDAYPESWTDNGIVFDHMVGTWLLSLLDGGMRLPFVVETTAPGGARLVIRYTVLAQRERDGAG
jgi:hypothetical protein